MWFLAISSSGLATSGIGVISIVSDLDTTVAEPSILIQSKTVNISSLVNFETSEVS